MTTSKPERADGVVRERWLSVNYHLYAPCQCVYPDRCVCFSRACGTSGLTPDEAWTQHGRVGAGVRP